MKTASTISGANLILFHGSASVNEVVEASDSCSLIVYVLQASGMQLYICYPNSVTCLSHHDVQRFKTVSIIQCIHR